eukprot:TRINITY_DN16833_c0_g1_i4.p1 TRINITY_DN16833_c0_g1~~TRINITY_DN16833_c0_g1_i4.p1  ORF type:complete len:129 (+),score=0.77 TRINITY_DN16833_c0_g1_i4:34-387(+)
MINYILQILIYHILIKQKHMVGYIENVLNLEISSCMEKNILWEKMSHMRLHPRQRSMYEQTQELQALDQVVLYQIFGQALKDLEKLPDEERIEVIRESLKLIEPNKESRQGSGKYFV